jgi:hypothetical protein
MPSAICSESSHLVEPYYSQNNAGLFKDIHQISSSRPYAIPTTLITMPTHSCNDAAQCFSELKVKRVQKIFPSRSSL